MPTYAKSYIKPLTGINGYVINDISKWNIF